MTHFTARRFILGGLIALAFGFSTSLSFASTAERKKIALEDISRYFNEMTTAQADFTQVNVDQTISTGTLKIKRPGRIRFEYNPPEVALVIAGGGSLAIFDGRSNTDRPERYPLRRTPLNIILERSVDLERRNMVVDHYQDGAKTIVTAQDPKHPEYGSIDLVFTSTPVELRQWVIDDGTGSRTTVILGPLEKTDGFPAADFSIIRELNKRNLGR